AMYLSAITLLTESKTLFKIVFPWAIIGALLSLVIADLTFEFPHFRYIHYFGNHGMFLFGNLYLVFVKGFRMNYKDFWFSGGVLIGLSIPVYFFNQAFDTNHLFLMHPPIGTENAFAFVGDWWPLALVALVFTLFHLIYLPFALAARVGKRSTS
ncbi:MAG: TIGR02206 family membrane protein, partial [bacterium]